MVTDYDRFWPQASDYVRYNPASRHRRERILRMVQKLPFRDVLDVGCGNGELLNQIARIRPGLRSLVGVELSQEAVALNRRRFPGMSFHVLDIEQSALDAHFDLITCSEVIEHLQDRRAAFLHLAAMLRPGGHLVITCPTGKVYPTDAFFGHTHHPSAAEIEADARAAGLRIVVLHNWGWPMLRLLKEMTNIRPDWALRRFATGRYTVGARLAANLLYGLNLLNRRDSPRGCQLFVLLRRETTPVP
ncbi:MAG: class I SAM-dependent methyltransferase [Myxococcales bacterium]|nr:class I SAM-dependent methyltransferase [Myxococcales bacterium]